MRVIEALFEILSVSGPLALVVMFITLALLSRRLGAVTHMPPYHRWLYIAAALAGIAAFFDLLYILSTFSELEDGLLSEEAFYLLTYHLPLAASLTIGAVVTWRYWGWLLVGERQD